MKKHKHSFIAVALLIVVSLPAIMFMQFQARQWYVRHQMEERLEKQQLHTLHIPVQKLLWHEKGKEILVDGKLFDVKTYSITDGIFTCTGLFDHEETLIKSQMEQFGKRGGPGTDAGNQLTVKFVSMLMYFSDSDSFTCNCYMNEIQLRFPYNQPFAPLVYAGVDAPPPKA